MSKFEIAQHSFTSAIIEVLQRHFDEYAEEIFQASPILGYLNNKTKAANRGSKARGAFANHYALYVVVEDYIKNGFADGKAAMRPGVGQGYDADLGVGGVALGDLAGYHADGEVSLYHP